MCKHLRDALEAGRSVAKIHLAACDVAVFCVCNRCEGCHVGCMVGADAFVHFADESCLQIERLDGYWRAKLVDVRRLD